MAKVSARIGITVKLTKDSQYEFIRPEISIEEIDTEGDVDSQLDKAVDVLRATFGATEDAFNEIIVSQLNRSLDEQQQFNLSKGLNEVKNRLNDLERMIKKAANESKTDKS